MLHRSVPLSIRRLTLFKIIILAWLFVSQVVLSAGADTSLGMQSSLQSNISNLSSPNESLNQSAYDVHVYVTNTDNERLKISLFIDFELKDSKEISSDSELKIDSYTLSTGLHIFKITWWDEDVKRSYEMQELKDIQNETSINLYTSNHEAPEKFEILVKLTNENSNNLEAFLYVDDSFEKSKEVSKDSSSELGTIKLDEGVHNLSVRWQDRDTKIEYEKTKKITVTRDDVLVFYAPQGISFESKQSVLPSEKKETISLAKDTSIKKSSLKNNTLIDNKAEDKTVTDKITTDYTSGSTNKVASESIAKAETRTNNLPGKASHEEMTNPLSGEALRDSDKIYLYAVLAIIAVYLMLRH
jgi:preprotein translocase subunit SecF